MWRKRLRTASFRKIRFNLTNTESVFGRRTVNHLFPKRDEPYTEDLGRKAAEFTIEAFIIGSDYLRQRDRLIKACTQGGPGRLVHPYYGNKIVVCTACEVRESAVEGGIARFNLTFREAGSRAFPSPKKSAKGIFALLGDEATDAAVQEFTDGFSVASQPQAFVDSVTDKVTEFTDAVDNSTAFITRNSDELADLAFSIRDLRDDIDQLINTPAVLGQRIVDAIVLIKDAVTEPRESIAAYKTLFNFGASDQYSSYSTASRTQETANLKATNNVIAVAAIASAAQVLVDYDFESTEEAEELRNYFLDAINRIQELENTSDDVFQSLDQLRVNIAASTPPEDQALPSIVEIVPKSLTNSIVLAFDLYGDLDKEQDIIDRNSVRNPALITGGQVLKVLSNV